MGNKGGKSSRAPKYKREFKFAILGIAASGKSTFAKQMRLQNDMGWSATELDTFYQIVVTNIFDGLKELCATMDDSVQDEENIKRIRYYKSLAETPALSKDEVDRIKVLWKDAAVRECNKYMISNSPLAYSLQYFIGRIDALIAENYVPSSDDILHARQRTTGATETTFIQNKVKFTLMDLGGQRVERNKWETALRTGVKGIFFFVSTDEYDIISPEDNATTKLLLSCTAFRETMERSQGLTVSLLFNKMDLFTKKISSDFSSFSSAFPDYKGKETKDDALKFIHNLFMQQLPDEFDRAGITIFNCCALDGDLMGSLFRETVQQCLMVSLHNNFPGTGGRGSRA